MDDELCGSDEHGQPDYEKKDGFAERLGIVVPAALPMGMSVCPGVFEHPDHPTGKEGDQQGCIPAGEKAVEKDPSEDEGQHEGHAPIPHHRGSTCSQSRHGHHDCEDEGDVDHIAAHDVSERNLRDIALGGVNGDHHLWRRGAESRDGRTYDGRGPSRPESQADAPFDKPLSSKPREQDPGKEHGSVGQEVGNHTKGDSTAEACLI